jgi:gamma-glutamylcyclotransferase (GGCT)/AIG2-like uncharacterized protein YtfP
LDSLSRADGTLIRGFKNHAAVLGGVPHTSRPAVLRGAFRLVHYEYGFPGLVPAGAGGAADLATDAVTGELVTVDPGADYAAATRALDALEDFDRARPGAENTYDRVVCRVEVPRCNGVTDEGADAATDEGGNAPETTTTEVVEAFVYYCTGLAGVAATPVPGGDWAAFMRARGDEGAGTEWVEGARKVRAQA